MRRVSAAIADRVDAFFKFDKQDRANKTKEKNGMPFTSFQGLLVASIAPM